VALDERTTSGNTIDYLLTDHQGSLSGITNSSGQLIVGESFHPYGVRRNPTTWTDPISTSDLTKIQGITPRGFTFKETLEYMKLTDLGGRVVDSFTGRFLSPDPVLQDPENPQDYNPYSYVVNNPLTFTDPTGFDCDFQNFFSNGCTVTGFPYPGICGDCVWQAVGVPNPRWPGVPYPYTPPQTKQPPQPSVPQCPKGQQCNKPQNTGCSAARALVASLGEQLSSTGNVTTWGV
jgi:RHS repeat-associated protein